MKRALVLSLICVLGLGFAGLAETLTGSWDTDVIIDPQQTSFAAALALTSKLTVNYGVGDWTFGSVTSLTEAGWSDQTFSAKGTLGAFIITSALDLAPDATFDEWVTTVGVSIAGVTFGGTFTLDGDDAQLVLTGKGGVGTPVVVDVSVTFGELDNNDGCELDFASILIGVDWTFCDCAPIEADIYFDCDGFQYVKFATSGIVIPNLPWVTLGAELMFTLQTKTLTLSTAFDWGITPCFKLYISVAETGNVTFNSISIDGIGLTCPLGGVTFSALSYWGTGTKPGKLADTEYWEVYSIATDDDACCGKFTFSLDVFFKELGSKLFDVALIDADMTLQVASQFAFNMGLEVNVETGLFTEWTIGFLVTW